eukprot:scaffold112258_cov57-Phaeocystis_antarctica.AAC.2
MCATRASPNWPAVGEVTTYGIPDPIQLGVQSKRCLPAVAPTNSCTPSHAHPPNPHGLHAPLACARVSLEASSRSTRPMLIVCALPRRTRHYGVP